MSVPFKCIYKCKGYYDINTPYTGVNTYRCNYWHNCKCITQGVSNSVSYSQSCSLSLSQSLGLYCIINHEMGWYLLPTPPEPHSMSCNTVAFVTASLRDRVRQVGIDTVFHSHIEWSPWFSTYPRPSLSLQPQCAP